MVKAPSLRNRLIVGLLLPLILLRFVSGHLHSVNLTDRVEGLQDAYLEDTLRGIERFVFEFPGDQVLSRLGRMLHVVQRSHLSEFLFAIRNSETAEKIVGDDWPGNHIPSTAISFYTTHVNGKPFRVVSKNLVGDQKYFLEIARESTAAVGVLEDSWEYLMLVQTLMILLVILVVSTVIRRSLGTLDVVVNEVAARDLNNLKPIEPPQIPAEILPLVNTMNKAFGRLQQEHDNQQSFLELASHQLKTPVAGMKATVDDLIRQGVLSRDKVETHRLTLSLDRMQSLCGKLMSLLKVTTKNSGVKSSEFGTVDAVEAAKSVIESLYPLAMKRGVDLGFHCEPTGMTSVNFPCESDEAHELLSILADNAIRYSPPGSHVDVVVKGGAKPVLAIVDDGPGIPAELRNKVFERFYRILGSSEDGSGLGLSIAKEICDRNKLAIAIDNGPDGKGSCFTVTPLKG